MTNDIVQAYRAGSEIGNTFHRIDDAMHNMAVQQKMDEILKATNERGATSPCSTRTSILIASALKPWAR